MSGTEPRAEAGRDPGEPAAASSPPPIHRTIYALICVVLVGYAAMMIFLAVKRGDANWDRLVFLFSGLEAIVFAAAGLAFGGSVQRGALNAAREDAAAARAEAGRQGAAVEAARGDSEVLNGVLAAISVAAAAERDGQGTAPESGWGDADRTAELPPGTYGARPLAGAPRAWSMAELEQFARTLRDRTQPERRTG